MIQGLFQRVVLVSLTTSVVLLPLLLLSGRIQMRYTARSCYLLWLLLAVRLLLPVQITLPKTVVTLPAPDYLLTLPQAVPAPGAALPVPPGVLTEAPPPLAAAVSLAAILAMAWLAGLAVFFVWQLGSYWLSRRYLLAGAQPDRAAGAVLEGLQAELGMKRPIPVVGTARIKTPMTLGPLRPVILLPASSVPAEELPLILHHELCHIRNRDLWYKVLLLAVNGVHWFNPLVWRMSREAGRNLEYCCDNAVVRGRDAAFRRRYGEVLLLNAAQQGGPILSTRFGDSKARLKGRLMNLFQRKKTGAALVCATFVCVLLAGGLVGCQSGAQAPSGSPQSTDTSQSTDTPPVTATPGALGTALTPSPTPGVLPSEEPADDQAAAEEGWQWPLPDQYAVSATFGTRVHPVSGKETTHDGTDIPAPEGTEVLAAQGGYVFAAGYDAEDGNYLELTHDGGISTLYGHLASQSVAEGDTVVQGQSIGTVGATGAATGAHLHLEFRVDGVAVDGLTYYPDLPLAQQ